MKKAIIFDLFGTLIDLQTDEENNVFWDKLAIYYGYSGAHYSSRELKISYQMEANRLMSEVVDTKYPDIDVVQVFRALYALKGIIVDEGKLKETASIFRLLSTSYIKLYPHAKELLSYLKGSGLKVILLSNSQKSFAMNELKLTGIDEFFDGVYISSDYKVCKPDPKFFNLMLEKENLKAEECIFIGNDHLSDIAGASDVGIDSIYLHTNRSQSVLSDFECMKKIIPGDLVEVTRILKNLR